MVHAGQSMEKSLLKVVFYESSNGNVPVLRWLRELDTAERKILGLDLLRVQKNWPIGMPVCKSLSGGLWEVRSSLSNGGIARMIFCMRENKIYVLHGFIKKTQATPKDDLDLARKRMKEVLK
jgi:phage-related protein